MCSLSRELEQTWGTWGTGGKIGHKPGNSTMANFLKGGVVD